MDANICPHLVRIAQSGGQPTFISPLNRCRAGGREATIGGATQARLCLTASHTTCPFVANTPASKDSGGRRQVIAPRRLSHRPGAQVHPLRSARHRDRLYLLAGAVLIVCLVAGLVALVPHPADVQAVAGPQPSSTPPKPPAVAAAVTSLSPTPLPLTATPTDTPTAIPTATPTATFTPIPTPTATPTPLRPPALSPPTRLVIPALDVDTPVVEVGWQTVGEGESAKQVWVVADYAAGFHRTSAYPGRSGNTVISGHNNIRGEVFRDLEKLVVGDEVTLYVGETAYPYTVAEMHILPDKWVSEEEKLENAKWIGYFPEERLTLITCWPYEGNSHRVVIVATPAERIVPYFQP